MSDIPDRPELDALDDRIDREALARVTGGVTAEEAARGAAALAGVVASFGVAVGKGGRR